MRELDTIRMHPRPFGVAAALLVVTFAFLCLLLMARSVPAQGDGSDDRLLIVSNALAPVHYLPRSYGSRIAALPGVSALTSTLWLPMTLGGDPRPVSGLVVDTADFDRVYTDVAIPAATVQAWTSDRRGVLIPETLATAEGWGPGTPLYAELPECGGVRKALVPFVVSGVFAPGGELRCERCLLLGTNVLTESCPRLQGIASSYLVRVEDRADPGQVEKQIDALFAAETYATWTTPFSVAAAEQFNHLLQLRSLLLTLGTGSALLALVLVASLALFVGRAQRRALALQVALGFPRVRLAREVALLWGGGTALCAAVGAGLTALLLNLLEPLLGSYMAYFQVSAPTFYGVVLAWLLIAGVATGIAVGGLAALDVRSALCEE